MKREFKIEVTNHIIGLNIEEDYEVPFVKNYGLFLSNGKPEISIDVGLSANVLTVDGPEARLELSDSLITIVDDYLIGSLDLKTKCGKIKINPLRNFAPADGNVDISNRLSSSNFLTSLGTFLRNIYTLLVVLEDRGIVLHAVGILKDEEVYIFVGPSNAGKTTVANLSRDKVVLSDDLVMIKKVNGEFKVFPTPYWGDKQIGPRQNKPYGINSIFKLIKDKQVYLERISPAYALADIFTIPHIPSKYIPKAELLTRFSELISAVSYYGLHFLAEPSFWDCIEELKSELFLEKEG